MSLVYADPQVGPPLLGSPWPDAEGSQVRRAVRRAAVVPLAICLGVQWVFLVAWGVPETAGLPGRSWWLTQLAPLALVPGHRLGAFVLLLAAAALFGLSRTRRLVTPTAMTVPAAVGATVAGLVLIRLLLDGRAGSAVLAALLLGAWVVAAWYAAVHALLVELGPPPTPDRRSGALLLAAWVLLLPGPLAVARMLLARDLRAEAEVLAGNTVALELSALLTAASVRLYLFGALLGVAAWLTYQCWPRTGTSRSWRWHVALALALVAVTQLWWSAQTSAARRVTELQYGTPAAELHATCATWVYPPDPGTPADTPTLTVMASGLGCRTVTTFWGYRQVATTATGVTVSPVAMRSSASSLTTSSRTASGAPVPAPLVGARYGDVLVLAGTDRADRVADQLVAVPLRGGPPVWRFSCPDKAELRARFPGGRPDPASPVRLEGEPGDVVVVTCAGRRMRFDPATGLNA